jgi:NAD(P)-dependent dehydrogenase (short-subunit alcohol dehydrogenase family)
LVVGGSSGIGREIVRQLEATDASVVLVSRNPEGVVEDAGSREISWDATESELSAEGLPEALDGLVYCPGTINLKPFTRLTDADFRNDFDINLMGAVRAIRAAIPALKRADPPASIVLFSTVAVGAGMPFHASIAAAKGAVEGLCRALAAELAPKIRVNAIAPSLTDTPLAGRLLSSEQRREASEKRHPMGRIGSAAEVAWLATHLLGDEMSWATGQVFHLDGGLSSVRT